MQTLFLAYVSLGVIVMKENQFDFGMAQMTFATNGSSCLLVSTIANLLAFFSIIPYLKASVEDLS